MRMRRRSTLIVEYYFLWVNFDLIFLWFYLFRLNVNTHRFVIKITIIRFCFIYVGRNLCKGIRLAAQHWRESNVELTEKYHNLENDVMNAFQHYLGVHDDCAGYFCQKTTNPDEAVTISILKETGMYYEVMDLCQYYFGNNVKSLLAGLCTNKTEGFNSLIAKTIGRCFTSIRLFDVIQ